MVIIPSEIKEEESLEVFKCKIKMDSIKDYIVICKDYTAGFVFM